MEKSNFVFHADSTEIVSFFRDNSNYIIEHDSEIEQNEKFCAIYFSSNGLYDPNTADAFNYQVVRTNKYEWYRTRVEKATKHIFLRDIKKQFYLNGINEQLNSVEKLFYFLQIETKGYKVIAIGSSSGGYAAVLFGSKLNAEIIYTFNGQFSLFKYLDRSSELDDPILFRERNNPLINRFFSINSYIVNPKAVFYFYSCWSKIDIEQYTTIKDLGLQVIFFKTSHHGIPFLKSTLSHVINMKRCYLDTLVGYYYYPLIFSVKIGGVSKTLFSLTNQLIDKYILKRFF
ncbi:hypothetical protein [Spirosoma endophyticum]|uniref:Uncharacterized protein n=1 Tax=Spirosoma endophyticum TaxID=662367 RepID=A0A1I2FSV4_9BACT|nr:hypothetical protein [Spirosoma endophyticum]SFF07740.1 hypothetical protein SAMN05216167_12736 [Spirosoma endophyticum]